jgi:hypothetical protein
MAILATALYVRAARRHVRETEAVAEVQPTVQPSSSD